MQFLRHSVVALLPLFFITPAVGQSSETPQPSTQQPQASDTQQPQGGDTEQPQAEDTNPGRRVRRPRPVNCWKQAGIAPALINQQWKIRDQSKVRIAGVCNEPSSSAQQKHDKIEQINMETEQAVAKLIPAKQLQAYKACQIEEGKNHPKAKEKELGPCGGVIPEGESQMDHH